MRRRTRGGFTLVELLVVITIIGMLVAMLVPAVGGIREQARLAKCLNRQHQLHTAASTYEAARGAYPSFSSGAAEDGTGGYSWVVALFPYIGENALYKKWTEMGETPAATLEFMVCPSNPPETTSISPANYKANLLIMREVRPYSCERVNNADGAQYTLLFSEGVMEGSEHARWDVTGAAVASQLCFGVEAADTGTGTGTGTGDGDGGSSLKDFLGSKHTAGVVVAMVSGTVRTISDDIADIVFQALVTPDGGEHVDESMLR